MVLVRSPVLPCAFAALLAALLACATPAAAQMGMLVYDWNPKVGSGVSYQLASNSGNTELELSTVGTEDVAGKTGYWIELTNIDTASVEKDLMVAVDSTHVHIARAIHQERGADPVEDPPTSPQSTGPVLSEVGDLIGREDVTTPEGTFSCQHYRDKDRKWDAWFSKEITPFGLVRMTYASGAEMVAVRSITGARDHITQPSQKTEPQPKPAPSQKPAAGKNVSPAGDVDILPLWLTPAGVGHMVFARGVLKGGQNATGGHQ